VQSLKGDLRAVADHPRAVVAEPPKPEGLGPVASEVWDQIVPELVRLRMVGRLDGSVVELFCTSFERWREHPGGPGYASLTSTVAHAARGLGLGAGARLRAEAPESGRDELERAIFGTDL
jgi:Phage terminase, small subunit